MLQRTCHKYKTTSTKKKKRTTRHRTTPKTKKTRHTTSTKKTTRTTRHRTTPKTEKTRHTTSTKTKTTTRVRRITKETQGHRTTPQLAPIFADLRCRSTCLHCLCLLLCVCVRMMGRLAIPTMCCDAHGFDLRVSIDHGNNKVQTRRQNSKPHRLVLVCCHVCCRCCVLFEERTS